MEKNKFYLPTQFARIQIFFQGVENNGVVELLWT